VLFDHIRRNSPFIFDDLGERRFKNLSEPIRVYQILPRGSADPRHRPNSTINSSVIASRSASFALAHTHPDPVGIGTALGVRYVLDGQVRKIGETIRIGLTLSETDAGSVVWSDKIARPFENLLDMLDETVSKIAATVAGRMEDASIVAARRRPPDNVDAFECLLRGIDHHRLGGVTDENAREAVKWFSRAIEADPNYAAAYAWRVCAASWLPEFNLGAAEQDSRRALELDPCDPEANRLLGVIECGRATLIKPNRSA
jgi:adenylate cyclase